MLVTHKLLEVVARRLSLVNDCTQGNEPGNGEQLVDGEQEVGEEIPSAWSRASASARPPHPSSLPLSPPPRESTRAPATVHSRVGGNSLVRLRRRYRPRSALLGLERIRAGGPRHRSSPEEQGESREDLRSRRRICVRRGVDGDGVQQGGRKSTP